MEQVNRYERPTLGRRLQAGDEYGDAFMRWKLLLENFSSENGEGSCHSCALLDEGAADEGVEEGDASLALPSAGALLGALAEGAIWSK